MSWAAPSIPPIFNALAGAGPMQASGLFYHRDARGKYGLVHNIGLGGAAVISLLRRPEFYRAGGPDGRDRYFSFNLPFLSLQPTLDMISL